MVKFQTKITPPAIGALFKNVTNFFALPTFPGTLQLDVQTCHTFYKVWEFPGSECSLCFLPTQSWKADVSGPGSPGRLPIV